MGDPRADKVDARWKRISTNRDHQGTMPDDCSLSLYPDVLNTKVINLKVMKCLTGSWEGERMNEMGEVRSRIPELAS